MICACSTAEISDNRLLCLVEHAREIHMSSPSGWSSNELNSTDAAKLRLWRFLCKVQNSFVVLHCSSGGPPPGIKSNAIREAISSFTYSSCTRQGPSLLRRRYLCSHKCRYLIHSTFSPTPRGIYTTYIATPPHGFESAYCCTYTYFIHTFAAAGEDMEHASASDAAGRVCSRHGQVRTVETTGRTRP